MRFSQRKLDRLVDRKAKLSARQQRVTLELAVATRQLFHDVFIENRAAPSDVDDFLFWNFELGTRMQSATTEIVNGRTVINTRKVIQAHNPDGVLMNVADYEPSGNMFVMGVIIDNAGLLAVSLAGGSIPEALLSESLRHKPVGASGPIPFDASITRGVKYAKRFQGEPREPVIVLDPSANHNY